MRGKRDTRDWQVASEVPAEITGQRRELMEMLFAAATGRRAMYTGSSPRTWKFAFPDSGGWSTVEEIRQDKIVPSAVAAILNGEAFSKVKYEAEILGVLRRLTGSGDE